MDYKTLSAMDKSQLREKMKAYRRDLFLMRFSKSASSLSDTSQFKRVRKAIARIKLLLV